MGLGVATATRKNILSQSAARVTLHPDATALVETDMTDIGTGTYAILGQIAAEMLGLPCATVVVDLEVEDGRAVARREVEGGHEMVELELPAVG